MEFTSRAFAEYAAPYWPEMFRQLGFTSERTLHVLEVGSFEGASACWFLTNLLKHPDSTLSCIDHWAGSEEHWQDGPNLEEVERRFQQNLAETGADEKVTVFRGKSVEMMGWMLAEQKTFDVVYIDASHTSWDTLRDACMGLELTDPNGGLMICDDRLWVSHIKKIGESIGRQPQLGIDVVMGLNSHRITRVAGYPAYQSVWLRTDKKGPGLRWVMFDAPKTEVQLR